MKRILTLIALLIASLIFAADKTIGSGTDHFDLVYEMTRPKLSTKSTLWIPRARNDAFQKLQVRDITVTLEPKSCPFNYFFGLHLEVNGKAVPVKATFEFKRLPAKE